MGSNVNILCSCVLKQQKLETPNAAGSKAVLLKAALNSVRCATVFYNFRGTLI
jgi:hypothetical protein